MGYYNKNEIFCKSINEKIDQLTGDTKQLADQFRKVCQGSFNGNYQCEGMGHRISDEALKLYQLLMEGKMTIKEVLEDGLKDFLGQLAGPQAAALLCQIAERLPDYIYQHSSYRRSFRSISPTPYFYWIYQLMESVYFDWSGFDLCEFLKMGREEIQERKYLSPYGAMIPHLIAAGIDNQNTQLIEVVKDIILSDNNTRVVDYNLIKGVAKSHNPELHLLMKNLLLAAKLQEGLRQSILETADDGSLEYFIMMIETILEHDLLRFSSCIRAVDVWMGLGYQADRNDQRSVRKILEQAYQCLTDEQVKEAAFNSDDAVTLYAGMFAESVVSVEKLMQRIEGLMKGKKHQKLNALYFMSQIGYPVWRRQVAAQYLNEKDLDLISLIVQNYTVTSGWSNSRENYLNACGANKGIAEECVRNNDFNQLEQLLECVPKNGYESAGQPFEWNYCAINREDIYDKMMVLAGYDQDLEKTHRLIDLISYADSDCRQKMVRFMIKPERSEKERTFLFTSLSDKSMPIRISAVAEIQKLDLLPDEILMVENLLALKTGEIRQGALTILKKLEPQKVEEIVNRLIIDKNNNKRLGALNLISEMVIAETLSQEKAKTLISLMPKITEQEQVLVDNITSEKQIVYDKSNGYGLYDPSYHPELPPIAENAHNLKTFRDISSEQMITVLESLVLIIEQYKEYTYLHKNWDGSESEKIFGTQTSLPLRIDVERSRNKKYGIDDYELTEQWKEWQAKDGQDLLILLKIYFCNDVKNYRGEYPLDYQDWANEMLKTTFGYAEIVEVIKWITKTSYGSLAASIVCVLVRSADQNQLFDLSYGMLADLKNYLQPEDWKRSVDKPNNYRAQRPDYEPDTFSDTSQFGFFLKFVTNVEDEKRFEKALGMGYEFGHLKDYLYIGFNELDIARAVGLGYVDVNDLYRTFFNQNPTGKMSTYTGMKNRIGIANVEKYPILAEVTDNIVQKIISIEVKRGDLKTAVSEMAQSIRSHKGVENFVEILVALGKETLSRGYIYGNTCAKKEVLSSLLRYCYPHEDDTAQKLRDCVKGRVSDERILEAAMYVPAWISIAQEYLGWKGLKSGAWYFHAHTSNSVPQEFEGEVAKFSPISIDNFRDGAFDISWFKSAYKELGKKKFEILYQSAKYISDGSSHRRAQLFADAVLGKLNKKDLTKNISEKRNKDQMLSYSLIPFSKKDNLVMKDALERYEFIQKFLKESKQFGAQRRESESKICAIAMDNLARNLGYADSLRFSWKMEVLKIEQIKQYFEPYMIEDTEVYLKVDDSGASEIMISKNGKQLKSVPAALKKHPYINELKLLKASMKEQFIRARVSLERAMENRDSFTFAEVIDLFSHPVIRPLVEKLIFKGEKGVGFLTADGLQRTEGDIMPLAEDDMLVIAHCLDLYQSGKWSFYQKYAFEKQLVQPFKQIFRELYTVNEDEEKEKTISRRYAGHQVQPKRTLALLKGRSWTVDYESGLQKVFYKENIIANIYALADWFSPADIEAPTLETVHFYDRKTGKPLELAQVDQVIFSETMRDVDLVVSVAHVGGVDPMASHSTVEMRGVIVKEALYLLKVNNVLVEGNHAKVKGNMGEYTVHLGSGIVHKMGVGALNILPVHSQQRGKIFLPFLDEDPKTAEILSKVLLLAEDNKIKDPTILSQIQ